MAREKKKEILTKFLYDSIFLMHKLEVIYLFFTLMLLAFETNHVDLSVFKCIYLLIDTYYNI